MSVNGIGRPTSCTPEAEAKILEAISAGLPIEMAANYAGVSARTYYTWKQRGDAGEEPYASFLHRLKAADSAAALKWAKGIDECETPGLWQRFAWKLERRHPKWFGKTSEATAPSPAEQETAMNLQSPDDVAKALRERVPRHILEKALAGAQGDGNREPEEAAQKGENREAEGAAKPKKKPARTRRG